MFLPTNPRFWAVVAIGYWVALMVATHVPSDLAPAHTGSWDKVAHFAGFALLGLFCGVAWRLTFKSFGLREAVAILLALSIYAALDECTQPWFGRNCDPIDWACDMAGATVGLIAAFVTIAVVTYLRRRPTPLRAPAALEPSGGR